MASAEPRSLWAISAIACAPTSPSASRAVSFAAWPSNIASNSASRARVAVGLARKMNEIDGARLVLAGSGGCLHGVRTSAALAATRAPPGSFAASFSTGIQRLQRSARRLGRLTLELDHRG